MSERYYITGHQAAGVDATAEALIAAGLSGQLVRKELTELGSLPGKPAHCLLMLQDPGRIRAEQQRYKLSNVVSLPITDEQYWQQMGRVTSSLTHRRNVRPASLVFDLLLDEPEMWFGVLLTLGWSFDLKCAARVLRRNRPMADSNIA